MFVSQLVDWRCARESCTCRHTWKRSLWVAGVCYRAGEGVEAIFQMHAHCHRSPSLEANGLEQRGQAKSGDAAGASSSRDGGLLSTGGGMLVSHLL